MSRTINGTIEEMRARFPGSDYVAVEHFLPDTVECRVYTHGNDLEEVRRWAGAPPGADRSGAG